MLSKNRYIFHFTNPHLHGVDVLNQKWHPSRNPKRAPYIELSSISEWMRIIFFCIIIFNFIEKLTAY